MSVGANGEKVVSDSYADIGFVRSKAATLPHRQEAQNRFRNVDHRELRLFWTKIRANRRECLQKEGCIANCYFHAYTRYGKDPKGCKMGSPWMRGHAHGVTHDLQYNHALQTEENVNSSSHRQQNWEMDLLRKRETETMVSLSWPTINLLSKTKLFRMDDNSVRLKEVV